MKIILVTLKKILFWSYERGSWQYDVMCVLILAFIFLSPNRMFQSQNESAPLNVRGDERGRVDPVDSQIRLGIPMPTQAASGASNNVKQVQARTTTRPGENRSNQFNLQRSKNETK